MDRKAYRIDNHSLSFFKILVSSEFYFFLKRQIQLFQKQNKLWITGNFTEINFGWLLGKRLQSNSVALNLSRTLGGKEKNQKRFFSAHFQLQYLLKKHFDQG